MTKLYVRWDDDGLQAATAAEIVAALRANDEARAEVLVCLGCITIDQACKQQGAAEAEWARIESRAVARAEAAEAKVAELETRLDKLQAQLREREEDLLDIAQSTRGDWESRSEAGGKAMLRVSGLLERLEEFESLESFAVGQPVSITLGAYTGFGKIADRGLRDRYLVTLNEPYRGETGFWASAFDIAAADESAPKPVQTSPFPQVAELEAELAALVPRSAMREAGRVPVTPIYQNGRYRVTREPAGDGTLYVVIGPTGRVYGPPMALRAAAASADVYQTEDDAAASLNPPHRLRDAHAANAPR